MTNSEQLTNENQKLINAQARWKILTKKYEHRLMKYAEFKRTHPWNWFDDKTLASVEVGLKSLIFHYESYDFYRGIYYYAVPLPFDIVNLNDEEFENYLKNENGKRE